MKVHVIKILFNSYKMLAELCCNGSPTALINPGLLNVHSKIYWLVKAPC